MTEIRTTHNIIGLDSELATILSTITAPESTFTQKLASENRWTFTYAQRVLIEYRRFLILARVLSPNLSPSPVVDQAWHLHLTYSRHYWMTSCENFFQRPFNHDPMDSAGQSMSIYRDQYSRTLHYYKVIFGEDPPPDIWPPLKDNAFYKTRYQRVDMDKLNFVLLFVGTIGIFSIIINYILHNTCIFWLSISITFIYLRNIRLAHFADISTPPSQKPGSVNNCGGGGGCGGCGGGGG